MALLWCAFLLGLGTPLLPVFGSGWLLALSALFLSLQLATSGSLGIKWAAPLLMLCGAWTLAELFWSCDVKSIELLWAGADGPGATGFSNLVKSAYYSPPFAVLVLVAFLRLVVLAALCSFFARHQEGRERFLGGLEIGLGISALLTATLVLFPASLSFPNQSEFWTSIDRVSGSFSDPNAFGIFIALVLPLLLWRMSQRSGAYRFYLGSLAGIWIILGAYAGSRSFFLALAIYALLYAAAASRRVLGILLGAAVLAVLVLNVIITQVPATYNQWTALLPEGAVRVLDSVTISNADTTFFSRLAFWKIGWALWMDNFFFGAGFEHFRFYVPEYAARLALGTGIWTDNSNNFYLGLFAETGLLGGIGFILTISALRWKESAGRLLKAPIIALVILLFVGPHLGFDEVAILSALLLALSCDLKHVRIPLGVVALAALAFAAIFLKSSLLSRGFYSWEREGEYAFRWTKRNAEDTLGCGVNGKATLLIRALNPDIATNPLNVQAKYSYGEARLLQLQNSEWQPVEFSCPHSAVFAGNALELRYSLETDRVWVPQKYGLGQDRRLLGLQVRQPS